MARRPFLGQNFIRYESPNNIVLVRSTEEIEPKSANNNSTAIPCNLPCCVPSGGTLGYYSEPNSLNCGYNNNNLCNVNTIQQNNNCDLNPLLCNNQFGPAQEPAYSLENWPQIQSDQIYFPNNVPWINQFAPIQNHLDSSLVINQQIQSDEIYPFYVNPDAYTNGNSCYAKMNPAQRTHTPQHISSETARYPYPSFDENKYSDIIVNQKNINENGHNNTDADNPQTKGVVRQPHYYSTHDNNIVKTEGKNEENKNSEHENINEKNEKKCKTLKTNKKVKIGPAQSKINLKRLWIHHRQKLKETLKEELEGAKHIELNSRWTEILRSEYDKFVKQFYRAACLRKIENKKSIVRTNKSKLKKSSYVEPSKGLKRCRDTQKNFKRPDVSHKVHSQRNESAKLTPVQSVIETPKNTYLPKHNEDSQNEETDLRTIFTRKRTGNHFNIPFRSKQKRPATSERENFVITGNQNINNTEMAMEPKPKKCKTIKLVINISCDVDDSGDDSDHSSSDNSSPFNNDLSFLDDFDIDDIVNSLSCGSIRDDNNLGTIETTCNTSADTLNTSSEDTTHKLTQIENDEIIVISDDEDECHVDAVLADEVVNYDEKGKNNTIADMTQILTELTQKTNTEIKETKSNSNIGDDKTSEKIIPYIPNNIDPIETEITQKTNTEIKETKSNSNISEDKTSEKIITDIPNNIDPIETEVTKKTNSEIRQTVSDLSDDRTSVHNEKQLSYIIDNIDPIETEITQKTNTEIKETKSNSNISEDKTSEKIITDIPNNIDPIETEVTKKTNSEIRQTVSDLSDDRTSVHNEKQLSYIIDNIDPIETEIIHTKDTDTKQTKNNSNISDIKTSIQCEKQVSYILNNIDPIETEITQKTNTEIKQTEIESGLSDDTTSVPNEKQVSSIRNNIPQIEAESTQKTNTEIKQNVFLNVNNDKTEISSEKEIAPVSASVNCTKNNAIQHLKVDSKGKQKKDKKGVCNQQQTSHASTHSRNNDDVRTNKQTFSDKLGAKISNLLSVECYITSTIHNGNFSTIFKCTSSQGDNYACKVLKKSSAYRIKGELKSIMLLKLQEYVQEEINIAYLFESFPLPKSMCFVMEYYPKNLEAALRESKKCFSIDLVQKLAGQLIAAVTVLTNHRIVHADIQPKHILLNHANNKLKLCGFDESNYIEYVKVQASNGSVNYRAPETLLGYLVDYRLDVWSTALVIYEMASGVQLFPGSNVNDVLLEQMHTLGRFPDELVVRSPFRHRYCNGKFFERYEKNYYIRKSNRINNTLHSAYYKNWRSWVDEAKYFKDLAKLRDLQRLLGHMLVVDPNNRLPISYAGIHRFIHDI